MQQLTYIVVPHNHGIQWLCQSTNFSTKGVSAMRPSVVGNCTVHTGHLAEHHARAEMLRLHSI